MFDRLVASAPPKSWSALGTLSSVAIHGAVLVLAVRATVGTGGGTGTVAVDTTMVFVEPRDESKAEEPPPVPALAAPEGFNVVIAPAAIPTSIPPNDLRETFDPRDYTGIGVERTGNAPLAFGTADVPSGGTWAEAAVDEKPEILSSPPLVYPDLLRQAGIEGSVLVEAIVDTTGRAEPGSIRVIQSANALFNPPALDVIARAVYRPGRVNGEPVRVLVNVPVNFSIRRRS
jgi:protein TonB